MSGNGVCPGSKKVDVLGREFVEGGEDFVARGELDASRQGICNPIGGEEVLRVRRSFTCAEKSRWCSVRQLGDTRTAACDSGGK